MWNAANESRSAQDRQADVKKQNIHMRRAVRHISDLSYDGCISPRVRPRLNFTDHIHDSGDADVELVPEAEVVCDAVEAVYGADFRDEVPLVGRYTGDREHANGEEDL